MEGRIKAEANVTGYIQRSITVQPGAGAQKLKPVPKHNSWCGPRGGRRLPSQDIGLCEHGYSILVN